MAAWIGAMRCCFFAVLLALFASAWAAGLARERPAEQAGDRSAPCPGTKERESAGPEADGADKAEGKPLYTALDNLTAYGTNRQQTEVEDRHEIWEE